MSETSDQMVSVLQEISVLKQLEDEYAKGVKGSQEVADHESRHRRLEELTQEIHRIAESKKENQSA
ncbi:MAG: hypothetical protein JWO91_2034 [Acidobacteriaceae bacterium]|jgi:hypothetical protein|nr:hypothetical protein [Acidobacteriaceae bacterium]